MITPVFTQPIARYSLLAVLKFSTSIEGGGAILSNSPIKRSPTFLAILVRVTPGNISVDTVGSVFLRRALILSQTCVGAQAIHTWLVRQSVDVISPIWLKTGSF